MERQTPQAFLDNWEIASNTAGAIETAAQEWRLTLKKAGAGPSISQK